MKIVGIGLNKTGTTTLGVCFQQWGLNHISMDDIAFDAWVRDDEATLLRRAAEFDSFEDWPWPLVYPALDRHFPGSKFVLTRRKSAEVWFASLRRHASRTGPTEYRRRVYGYAMPGEDKDAHLEFYRRHLREVRHYFRSRPGDLLEVCWEEGDGWGELASFLGLVAPERPFPHANRSPSHWSVLGGRWRQLRREVRRRIAPGHR